MWFPYKLDLNNTYIPVELRKIAYKTGAVIAYSKIYGLVSVNGLSDSELYETEQECIDACNWMNKKENK